MLLEIGGHSVGVCAWSLEKASMSSLDIILGQMSCKQIQLALVPLIESSKEKEFVLRQIMRGQWILLSGMVEMIGEDYSSLASIKKTGGVWPDNMWTRNQERFMSACDIASELSLELITMHAGFIPSEKDFADYEKIVGRVSWCADYASKQGLALALETGQESPEGLLAFMRTVNCSNLGVNFDPANMILYGTGDPIQSLKLLYPFVLQVHLKDAIPSGNADQWGLEVPVGDGHVVWDMFLEIIEKELPNINLIAERESGETRPKDLRSAIDYINDIYKEL